MKALSIIMPWPWLILCHGKDIENRSWKTDYRGRILIHASKKPDYNLIQILSRYHAAPTNDELKQIFEWCGCIVGSVELVDCVENSNSRWAEDGLWHWVLKDPRPCKPIPVKGTLGLWEYNGVCPEEEDQ
jgi:hypothetical protein